MSAGLFILAQVDAASGYGVIALGIAVMGIGMGLTLAPAGESIMSVLPPGQAGVGSAVNDTVQELGGSLGVAVIGSIVSAAFRHGLDQQSPSGRRSSTPPGPRSPPPTPSPPTPCPEGQRLIEVARHSFITAMTSGFAVAGTVAALGAVVAALALPRRSAATTGESRAIADASAGITLADDRSRMTA